MAAHAISKVADTLLAVLRRNFIQIMAAIAIVNRQAGRMAGLAGIEASFAVVDRKCVRQVELRWRPAIRGMAGVTVRREQATMIIRLSMAAQTIYWRAFEHVVDMATSAFYCLVSACQRESGLGVIHRSPFPSIRRMARAAILPKLALMVIIFLVAGKAILRRAFEHPATRTLEMTIVAGHLKVLPLQLESRQCVVERGWLPARRRVAFPALLPKLTLVRVVFLVAGEAILGRSLQVLDRPGRRMAPEAVATGMLPLQGKRQLIVVKAASITVYAIMAIQTGFPKGLQVSLGKLGVALLVTAPTGRFIKRSKASRVAIGANYYLLDCSLLVRLE